MNAQEKIHHVFHKKNPQRKNQNQKTPSYLFVLLYSGCFLTG